MIVYAKNCPNRIRDKSNREREVGSGVGNVRQEAFKIIAYVFLKSKAMSIQSHKTHRGVDD